MKLLVCGQRIVITDPFPLVTGTTGVYRAEFDIRRTEGVENVWDTVSEKIAIFKPWVSGQSVLIPLDENNSCDIPYEVLTNTEGFRIGLFGIGEGITYPTVWSGRFVLREGCSNEGEAAKPPETIWDKITELVEESASSAIIAREAAVEAADEAAGAQNSAESAANAAILADRRASSAEAAANNANGRATEALTAASEAASKANAAELKAVEAKDTATTASNIATTAEQKAIESKQIAEEAKGAVDNKVDRSELEELDDKTEENLKTKVDKSTVDGTPLVRTVTFNTNGTRCQIVLYKRNLIDGSDTSGAVTIPLSTDKVCGLITPEQVKALSDVVARVAALEGQTIRLIYTAKENPSKSEVNLFVVSLGYKESQFGSIAVVVANTFHIWHYYANDREWKDDGMDTVEQAGTDKLGVVKGCTVSDDTYGKIYIESDGTMSLIGWDDLVATIQSLMEEKADKNDVHDLSERVEDIEDELENKVSNDTFDAFIEYYNTLLEKKADSDDVLSEFQSVYTVMSQFAKASDVSDAIDEIISAIGNKQDKLIAGDNITIENNVISAKGGGGGGEGAVSYAEAQDLTADQQHTARRNIDAPSATNPDGGGINLYDEDPRYGYWNAYSSTGAFSASSNQMASNKIKIPASRKIVVNCPNKGKGESAGNFVLFYREDGSFLLGQSKYWNWNAEITGMPAEAYYIAFDFGENYGGVYNNDITITDHFCDYEPYFKSNIQLTNDLKASSLAAKSWGDITTAGLTFVNCRYEWGGYLAVGNLIFIQMKVTTTADCGAWSAFVQGLPSPGSSNRELAITVASYNANVKPACDINYAGIRPVATIIPSGVTLSISGWYLADI